VAITRNGSDPDAGDWVEAQDTSGNGTWATWEYDWDTSDEDDGNYTIWARAYDGIAYSRIESVNVTLLNQDPPGIHVDSPGENATVNGSVTIAGSAWDEDPTDEVQEVYVAVVPVGEVPTGDDWESANDTSEPDEDPYTSWEYDWASTDVEDGDYTIHARCTDGNGWSREYLVNITVDNVNTDPRTRTTDPGEDADVSGTVEIRGYVTDPDDKIEEVQVAIDDDTFASNTLDVNVENVGEGRWNFSALWDTTQYNEGTHTIFARARDARDALSNTWAVNVTVYANVPPKIHFVAPGDDDVEVYKGETTTFVIQWDADDPDDNASIALYFDDDRQGYDGTLIVDGLYEDTRDDQGRVVDKYQWDITDVPAGGYYLYAEIDDGENPVQRNYSVGRVVIHEGEPNTPPEIDITEPDGIDDRIELNGTFIIWFNASDGDGDPLSIRLYRDNDTDRENGHLGEVTGSALDGNDDHYPWNTTGVPRGRYYVLARVSDGRGDPVYAYSPGPVTIGDMTPPSAVSNLIVENTGFGGSIGLIWTAPGDDGDVGTVDHYEIRRHDVRVTASNWDEATPVTVTLSPGPGGTMESVEITGLENGRAYWIGIRAFDDAGNAGPIVSDQATPTRVVGLEVVPDLPDGLEGVLIYLGTGTVSVSASTPVDGPSGKVGMGVYLEIDGSGHVSGLRLNLTVTAVPEGVDIDTAAIYRRVSGGRWSRLTQTGYDAERQMIWGVLDHLSLFAPFADPLPTPTFSSLSWDPQSPEDGDTVTFRITYTDPAGRVPSSVYLYLEAPGGALRYPMSLVEGNVTEGAVYQVTVDLSEGEYTASVMADVDGVEVPSQSRTFTVEKGGEGAGTPWPLVAAGAVIVVIILVLVVHSRRRPAGKGLAGAKAGAEGPPADVVDAVVVGDAFEEVEVTEGP